MFRAVLWDVDGTLISTKQLYLECYRRALMPCLGRALSDEELMALRPRSELRLLQSQAGAAYQACIADFARHYADLHTTHFGGVYEGVLDVLHALRAAGISNGIVSGKSRSSWQVTLAQVDLGEFDAIVLDDDVANPKPDPEGIITALAMLQVAPRHAAYVGDTPSDVESARAAGVTPIAALWARHGRLQQRLTQVTTECGGYVAQVPADVLAIVLPRRRRSPANIDDQSRGIA